MKLIKPSVEFLGAVPTDYSGALKFIERAGRTCYRSEDKITETSAEGFVKRLIKAGHLAMVEHSNLVVRHDNTSARCYGLGKYLNYTRDRNFTYIGGNITAWYQQCIKSGMALFSEPFMAAYSKLFTNLRPDNLGGWQVCSHDEIPKELHRYSAKFICDRGVSHELVRHRPCSFAQESTRYVDYGGKDMEFIEPAGFEDWSYTHRRILYDFCNAAEETYKKLLKPGGLTQGLKPQQARAVLPNALKTEIIVTADAAEWQHIKNLRTSKAAHPDMQRVMNMVPWGKIL